MYKKDRERTGANAQMVRYSCLITRKKKSYDRHSLKRPSENVAKFEYLEMTVTNQNNIHKQVRNTPKLGNASYHFHPVVSHLKSTDKCTAKFL